jgi:PKD repeat protein
VARVRRDSETGMEGIGMSRGYRPLNVGESEVGYCGSGMKTAPRPRRSLRSAYRLRGHATTYGLIGVFVAAIAVFSMVAAGPTGGLLAGMLGTEPPVASFVVTPTALSISVDATLSNDPDGTIVSYDWVFGDGATATGVTASHTYATWGTWMVILTVTDNDAMTGSMSVPVTVSDPSDPPPMPYNVWGYVLDSIGGMAFSVPVTITDTTTGAVWSTVTDTEFGYYMVDLNLNETGWAMGHTIEVEANSGLEVGTNSGVAGALGYEAAMQLDITMVAVIPEFSMLIVPVLGMVGIAAVVSLTRRREK